MGGLVVLRSVLTASLEIVLCMVYACSPTMDLLPPASASGQSWPCGFHMAMCVCARACVCARERITF